MADADEDLLVNYKVPNPPSFHQELRALIKKHGFVETDSDWSQSWEGVEGWSRFNVSFGVRMYRPSLDDHIQSNTEHVVYIPGKDSDPYGVFVMAEPSGKLKDVPE